MIALSFTREEAEVLRSMLKTRVHKAPGIKPTHEGTVEMWHHHRMQESMYNKLEKELNR